VKIFVPCFSQIVLPLQVMIKKNSIFKWVHNEIESFELIKQAIIDTPSLITHNISDQFILYTFSSELAYFSTSEYLSSAPCKLELKKEIGASIF